MPEIRIDPEFRGLLRPLTDEEREALESSLLEDGCLDPLVVWEEEGILLDGHHRYDLCEQHGLSYKRARVSFPGREEAKEWVRRKQKGRRNLTAAQMSALRGREYNAAKADPSANLKKGRSEVDEKPNVLPKCHSDTSEKSTAERVAEKHGVSPETIKRDGKFAEAVDAAPEETRKAVLDGELPKSTVLKPPPEPEPVPVDGWGVPIQEHAAEAFKAQPLFDDLLSLLRKADRLYSQLAEHPGGAYLLRAGISVNARDRWKHKGIKDALYAVEDCRPTYTVCPRAYHLQAFPDCQDKTPHGDDCTLCHGLGWSRALGKKEVYPEIVAAIREAFGVSEGE